MQADKKKNRAIQFSQFGSYALLSIIWFALGWVVSERLNIDLLARFDNDSKQSLRIIDRTAALLTARQFPTTQSPQEVAYNAINGMLEFGSDPHAAFYKGLAAQRYQVDFLGNTGTPGLYFTIENTAGDDGEIAEERFVIIEVVSGGPSEEAGLAVDDQIVAIDGVEIDRYSSGNEVAILLRGPLDQPIDLRVLRDGAMLDFVVERRPPQNLTAKMLENQIGYIRQRAFTETVRQQFQNELDKLSKGNLTGLIWDLRGNRGGSMEIAQKILSNFIPEGELFTVELKNGSQRSFKSLGESLASEVRLVLLIDERTLSASEASALAIRDHKRGIIIGVTSGGKGTVQETAPLDDEHLLHYSIGKWLSSTGLWIDEIGVSPDIIIEDNVFTDIDEPLQAAIDHLLTN